MDAIMVGDAEIFAIEYQLIDREPLYGFARLWIRGLWVGEIDSPCLLGYLYRKLYHLHSSRIRDTELVFLDPPTREMLDRLVGLGNWSFNEAFFDFDLLYYGILSQESMVFQWDLSPQGRTRYPDYPVGPHSASILFPVWDSVLESFLGSCLPDSAKG